MTKDLFELLIQELNLLNQAIQILSYSYSDVQKIELKDEYSFIFLRKYLKEMLTYTPGLIEVAEKVQLYCQKKGYI